LVDEGFLFPYIGVYKVFYIGVYRESPSSERRYRAGQGVIVQKEAGDLKAYIGRYKALLVFVYAKRGRRS